MSLLPTDAWEIADLLAPGQVAICSRCKDFWLDRADLQDIDGPAICENCGVAGAFYAGYLGREHKDKALASRWDSKVLERGWTATPDLLVDSLFELGIDEGHYLLLRILESYRRKGRDAVRPSIETIQARTPGWSRSKVERKLRELRKRHLIESEPRRRGGVQAPSGITRNGLDARLLRIAERETPSTEDQHVTHDVLSNDPFQGVSTSPMTYQHVTGDVDSTSPVTYEAEEREAEEGETDSPIGAARGAGEGLSPPHSEPVFGSSVESPPATDAPFDQCEVGEESVVGFDPAIEGDDHASVDGAASVASACGRSVGVVASGNEAGSTSFGKHVADGNPPGGGGGERRAADLTDAEVLDAFGDAEPLDGEAGSLAADCWHPGRHAGREWRPWDSSRWQCGVCHPPVVAAVWRDAA